MYWRATGFMTEKKGREDNCALEAVFGIDSIRSGTIASSRKIQNGREDYCWRLIRTSTIGENH